MYTRCANKFEYNELRNLWYQAFGDGADYIDQLYGILKAEGFILVDENQIKSCLTIFDVGTFDDKIVTECYAICTEINERGKGYASKLTEDVRDELLDLGRLPLICPASESLISFYEGLQFDKFFYVNETAEKVCDDVILSIKKINPHKYNEYREVFLSGIPHIKLYDNFLEFIRFDSHKSDGLLLINDGDAVCVLESVDDNTVVLSELIINPKLESLSSEIKYQIANGIASTLNAKNYVFKNPVNSSSDFLTQGMIAGKVNIKWDSNVVPYFGFPIE